MYLVLVLSSNVQKMFFSRVTKRSKSFWDDYFMILMVLIMILIYRGCWRYRDRKRQEGQGGYYSEIETVCNIIVLQYFECFSFSECCSIALCNLKQYMSLNLFSTRQDSAVWIYSIWSEIIAVNAAKCKPVILFVTNCLLTTLIIGLYFIIVLGGKCDHSNSRIASSSNKHKQ